jgi:putative heme-binding domain-containing protein
MPAALRTQKNDANQGRAQYVAYCSACHGADGQGGDKVASLATRISALTLSEAELSRIVREGTGGGMPPFEQIGDANIGAVVRYLRTLEADNPISEPVTGDVNAGRTLFFGKAECSNCHMIAGKGGFIASDLTVYGKSHSGDAIQQAIVTPDTPLARQSRVIDVTTGSGTKLTGVLRNEDNFNLELQTQDGRYYFLARSSLKNVRYTGHSLMPRDYAAKLTAKDLNDIASFLIVKGRSAPPNGEPPATQGGK